MLPDASFLDRYFGGVYSEYSRERLLSGADRQRLNEFFGNGLHGAMGRWDTFRVPEALDCESLRRYHEIARRQVIQEVPKGRDSVKMQVLRMMLVERALLESGC